MISKFMPKLLVVPFLLLTAGISEVSAKVCLMPHTPNGDDSPGIIAAAANCLVNSTIIFAANTTYNLLTPLSFTNLQNVRFEWRGNASLSTNVSAVQAVVNDTSVYPGHWITVKGSDVVFSGSLHENGGWFLGECNKLPMNRFKNAWDC